MLEQRKALMVATFQSCYLVRCDVLFLLTLGDVPPHLPAVIFLPEAIRATLSMHDTLGYWRKNTSVNPPVANGNHRRSKQQHTLGRRRVIVPAKGEGNTKISTLRKELLDIWEIYKFES